MTAPVHVPVMLAEMLATLAPRDGETYVDGTFGRGGWSRAILERADCRVVAIDRDPTAQAAADALAAAFPGRFRLIAGRFGDMAELVAVPADGVALDLGVSSPQLDRPERGFSFRVDGPLDMRMGTDGPTAADLVAETDERALADLIFELGEERHARRVARAIVAARASAPIITTGALAAVVRRAVPRAADGLDPATRTFQALRMAVNDELGEIARGLDGAARLLRAEGRLVVVAFHSLEDRVVKRFLQARSGEALGSRHLPRDPARPRPAFRLIERKPRKPAAVEIAANPRAGSARLRWAVRLASAEAA
jgi:16S rRNA (cytosine1402-N4)-methyltransferase